VPVHVVRQGEHLARIIRAYGFTDVDQVWDHGPNRLLRDQGRTPATLAPGDLVTVPEMQLRTITRATEQRHTVRVKQRVVRLALTLRDAQGRPAANVPCTLRLGHEDRALVTTADGAIDEMIPAHLEEIDLAVGACDSPLANTSLRVLVGHLDPVDLVSGQEARLNNLGYRAGTGGDVGDAAFRSAVEEFQCDQGLTVDGICGPKTRTKLVAVHGS